MVPSLQMAGPGVPSKHWTGKGSGVLVGLGCAGGSVGATGTGEVGNDSGGAGESDSRPVVGDGVSDNDVGGRSIEGGWSAGAEQPDNARTAPNPRTANARQIRMPTALPSIELSIGRNQRTSR